MSEITITAPLRSRFGVSLPILFALLVYANVIGLPLGLTVRLLGSAGVRLSDPASF